MPAPCGATFLELPLLGAGGKSRAFHPVFLRNVTGPHLGFVPPIPIPGCTQSLGEKCVTHMGCCCWVLWCARWVGAMGMGGAMPAQHGTYPPYGESHAEHRWHRALLCVGGGPGTAPPQDGNASCGAHVAPHMPPRTRRIASAFYYFSCCSLFPWSLNFGSPSTALRCLTLIGEYAGCVGTLAVNSPRWVRLWRIQWNEPDRLRDRDPTISKLGPPVFTITKARLIDFHFLDQSKSGRPNIWRSADQRF